MPPSKIIKSLYFLLNQLLPCVKMNKHWKNDSRYLHKPERIGDDSWSGTQQTTHQLHCREFNSHSLARWLKCSCKETLRAGLNKGRKSYYAWSLFQEVRLTENLRSLCVDKWMHGMQSSAMANTKYTEIIECVTRFCFFSCFFRLSLQGSYICHLQCKQLLSLRGLY